MCQMRLRECRARFLSHAVSLDRIRTLCNGNLPKMTIATVGASANARKPAVKRQIDMRARVKSFCRAGMPSLTCSNLSVAGNIVVFNIMAAVALHDSK